MRRAVVISPTAQKASVAPKKPEKGVAKYCQREGCGNTLKATQKKYCSHVCNVTVNKPPNAGKGKPTTYKPEFSKEVMNAYLEFCEKGNEPILIPTKTGFIQIPNAQVPTKEGFAEYLLKEKGVDVHITTIELWQRTHFDFAEAVDRLLRVQKIHLINHGSSGRYQGAIPKLLLSVNHGMHEKKLLDKRVIGIGIVKHMYETADKLEEHGTRPA